MLPEMEKPVAVAAPAVTVDAWKMRENDDLNIKKMVVFSVVFCMFTRG